MAQAFRRFNPNPDRRSPNGCMLYYLSLCASRAVVSRFAICHLPLSDGALELSSGFVTPIASASPPITCAFHPATAHHRLLKKTPVKSTPNPHSLNDLRRAHGIPMGSPWGRDGHRMGAGCGSERDSSCAASDFSSRLAWLLWASPDLPSRTARGARRILPSPCPLPG